MVKNGGIILLSPILLLSSTTTASLSDIQTMYKEMSNQTEQSLDDNSFNIPLRSFAPNGGTWSWIGQALLQMIGEGYGCWCYFQEDVGKGKSDPIDRLDSICKILHQGYECSMLDDSSCVPYNAQYNRPNVFFIGNKEQIRPACEAINAGNQCNINACTVETSFVFSVF